MILTTTHNIENTSITEYLGIVTGETIIGACNLSSTIPNFHRNPVNGEV